jgi:hypothetical protein
MPEARVKWFNLSLSAPCSCTQLTPDDKAEPKPVEITVNISLFWSKEFAKDAKKRSATTSGIMTSQSNDSYRKFEHSFLAKVARLAQLVIPPDNDKVQVQFQVPRHVKKICRAF